VARAVVVGYQRGMPRAWCWVALAVLGALAAPTRHWWLCAIGSFGSLAASGRVEVWRPNPLLTVLGVGGSVRFF
jgi:hypothetical protein